MTGSERNLWEIMKNGSSIPTWKILDFSGDLWVFPGGKNRNWARGQWEKTGDFPAKILLSCFYWFPMFSCWNRSVLLDLGPFIVKKTLLSHAAFWIRWLIEQTNSWFNLFSLEKWHLFFIFLPRWCYGFYRLPLNDSERCKKKKIATTWKIPCSCDYIYICTESRKTLLLILSTNSHAHFYEWRCRIYCCSNKVRCMGQTIYNRQ